MALVAVLAALHLAMQDPSPPPPRVRDRGITIGTLAPGPRNAITDVAGVRVGHATRHEGDAIRTGVTVILPHGGDPFRSRVPAAIVTQNGFGKLAGTTQVDELGELETPIALTSTLCVGRVADALVSWTLAQPDNTTVQSVNPVVGETNDGFLNDGRGRHVTTDDVLRALESASVDVTEGVVGAGTGTRCFGWKGGIGTASRRSGTFTVGVLVQTNFGGRPLLDGVVVDAAALAQRKDDPPPPEDGSCMIVIATDAPVDARNLRRLARRAFTGMARTGASFSNGSGDYAIAFSTATELRNDLDAPGDLVGAPVLRNDAMSPLFVAAAEATEEAIWNSLFTATTVTGRDGHRVDAFPVDAAVRVVEAARASGTGGR